MDWPQVPLMFLGMMVLITGCADLSASAPTPATIAVRVPTEPPRPKASSTVRSEQSPTSDSKARSAGDTGSPLRRRDPVPAGVAAQLALGTGGWFPGSIGQLPEISFPMNPIEIGSGYSPPS